MKKLRFLLILICLPVWASVDPTCTQQPQQMGIPLKVLGFEGAYVGTTSTNKAVFYNLKAERLYIFENGLEEVPVEIPWNQNTDLRWKEEHPVVAKSFLDYKNEGIKSYLSSLGVKCGIGGGSIHPANKNVIATAVSTACTEIGKSPSSQGGKCCEGTIYNPNNQLCDEPNFKDPQFKTCTAHSQCQSGMGCLPQTSEVLFTTVSDKLEVSQFNEFMRGSIDEQMADSELLANGQSCTHSANCASYNCENARCQEVKICRYGEENEVVDAGTKCNEAKHLVKGAGGVCELSAESKHALYLGLYPEGKELFSENTEAGKCQFDLAPGVRERTQQALKSIRAMEWLFASISRNDSDDCFRINAKLRDKIGKPFLEQRKYLLQDFSTYFSSIKRDLEIVQAAKMSNMDEKVRSEKQVEVHGAVNEEGDVNVRQTISEYELATRQSSGYDTMMFMYRRNLLFQSYERGMLTNVAAAYDQIASLNTEMAKWKDGDKNWNLGDQAVSAFNCKAKYKKFDFKRFKWRTRYYSDISNRWTDYYEVAGNQPLNIGVVKADKVLEQLRIIGNLEKEEDAIKVFDKHHYLLDPLMPGKTNANGGLPFTRYGDKKDLNGKPNSAFVAALGAVNFNFGIFGSILSKFGKKDQRSPRYLIGQSESKSYAGLRKDFRAKIIQFYQEMKLNQGQAGFIFEPELISTDAVDCIDKLDKDLAEGDKCSEFYQFVEDLTDYGMAQFLAYSYHTKSKYSGYFTNSQTWRRRLLTRLEVDLLNLRQYYHQIINLREKQISCLESVINHVSDSYLSGGNTVGQGGRNYYDGGNYEGDASKAAKVSGKIATLSAASRQKYSFTANTSAWKGIADSLINSTRDNVDSSTNVAGDSSVVGDASTHSQALRQARDRMNESNNKLNDKGINVSEKNSKFLASLGLGSGSRSGGNSSGSGIRTYSSGGGFDFASGGGLNGDLNGPGAGSLDGNLDSSNQLASIAPGGPGSGSAPGAGFNSIGHGGYVKEGSYGSGNSLDGSGSYGADANGANGAYEDPTGMSDHEKNIMMSNLERTKGRYKPEDTDSLFEVVSKAYVRNLEKILTRRKKID